MVVPSFAPENVLVGSVVRVPPPQSYKPLVGQVRNVSIQPNPWQKSRGATVAQMNGLRYEGRIQNELSEKLRWYLQSPALHFRDDSGLRFLVPDGILNLAQVLFVFEIKVQHMPEAWWQLQQYKDVLRARNKIRPVVPIEIVKSYDPSMPFPCRVDVIKFDDLLQYRGEFGVIPWKS